MMHRLALWCCLLVFTPWTLAQPYDITCQQMIDGEELPGEYIIRLDITEAQLCEDAGVSVGFRMTLEQFGAEWKGIYLEHKQSNLVKPVVDNVGRQSSFTVFVPVADVMTYDMSVWDYDSGVGPDRYVLYRLVDTDSCFKPGFIYNFVYQSANRCCMEIDGLCFNDDPPFDHLPLPECPDEIVIVMTVYTQTNPTEGQAISRTTIPPAWESHRRTIVIVHGWLGSDDDQWMQKMKDAGLERGDYNMITLSWDESSQQIWYPRSASDTRSVGAHIAAVFDNLVRNGGADPADFYCTGHSLGSHVCGHAGAYSQSLFDFTMGRITGMDPAGPLFEGKYWEVGLNPSCATFVDAMHTHGTPNIILNLGTMKLLGDVDFFPNRGDTQPGCILDPLTEEQKEDGTYIDLTPACSHMRALHYYLESITNECFYSRYLCTDQHDLPGSCQEFTEPIQAMGFDAEAEGYMTSGIFYLETNDEDPFCLG